MRDFLAKLISFYILILIVFIVSMQQFACTQEDAETDVSSLPQMRLHAALRMLPVPAGLGVNIHFYIGNDSDLLMLNNTGTGIIRMDVLWGMAEKTPGEYDFSKHDHLVNDLEQLNIRLLFIICYGNENYDQGLSPYTAAGRSASARFCAQLARRYATKKIIWELWNEPNIERFWRPEPNVADYMAWCKAVVAAIRGEDPQACIVAPAVSSIDIPFLEACFQEGLLDLIDGVSVHPYRGAHLAPETAIAEYNQLSILIETYKAPEKSIPIISGEWGYSTTNLSKDLQGEYLVRQWLCNMAYGIPISIWYDWHDDGQNPLDPEHNFGTVTWDYQPKSAYLAMQTLIRELRGFLSLGRLALGSEHDYIVPFYYDGTVKLAIWTTLDSNELNLGSTILIEKVVDHLGKEEKTDSASKFQVHTTPLYITLKTPIPDWLQMVLEISRVNEIQAGNIAAALLNNKNKSIGISAKIFKYLAYGSPQENRMALHAVMRLANRLENNDEMTLRLAHMVIKERGAHIVDKKQALTRIASIGAAESMQLVDAVANSPELSQEVACYYLRMAYKFVQQNRIAEADELLIKGTRISHQRHLAQRIISEMQKQGRETNDFVREKAAEIGFIYKWWIAGPFPNEKDIAEKKAYFPEEKIVFKQTEMFGQFEAKWQVVEIGNIWGIISFAELYGRQQQAAYAYARIQVPQAMEVRFKIGSNDGVICWLNGKKVHENLIPRTLQIDEDVLNVHFRSGINHVLLKIPNKGANWEACLRVFDTANQPLDMSKYLRNTE